MAPCLLVVISSSRLSKCKNIKVRVEQSALTLQHNLPHSINKIRERLLCNNRSVPALDIKVGLDRLQHVPQDLQEREDNQFQKVHQVQDHLALIQQIQVMPSN